MQQGASKVWVPENTLSTVENSLWAGFSILPLKIDKGSRQGIPLENLKQFVACFQLRGRKEMPPTYNYEQLNSLSSLNELKRESPVSDVILTWYSSPCKLWMEHTLEPHTYKDHYDCMLKPFCLWKFIIGQLKTDMFSTLKPHACTLCQMFSLINIKWCFLLETGSRLALDKMVSSLLAPVVGESVA